MEANNNEDNLKLIGFRIDGMRKLSAIDITFGKNGYTEIRGKNRVGKSTILKAIEWLIKGNKVLNSEIINQSTKKIDGFLNLGDYTIKRSYTSKSARLEVRNTKTNTLVKGEIQNFLDTLINELTLNPRPFLDMTPYQKLQFCLELFAESLNKKSKEILGMDFGEIDKRLATMEEDRLLTGREVKKFGEVALPDKVEKVDVSKLNADRKKIEEANQILLDEYESQKESELRKIEVFNKEQRDKAKAIEVEEDRLNDCLSDLNMANKEISEIIIKIKDLQLELDEKKKTAKEAEDNITDSRIKLDKLSKPLAEKPLTTTLPKPELQSTDTIDKQIQEAGAINEKADAYLKAVAKRKEKEDTETEYKAYDHKINNLRKKKFEVLQSIETGVDGLEITENGLYRNGIFCENWSDSEGLKTAAELCMARNPKLRAVFIDRFESFDNDSKLDFQKWASEHNVEVVVTIVDSTDKPEAVEDGVFYIQEGKLITSGNNGKELVEEEVE